MDNNSARLLMGQVLRNLKNFVKPDFILQENNNSKDAINRVLTYLSRTLELCFLYAYIFYI